MPVINYAGIIIKSCMYKVSNNLEIYLICIIYANGRIMMNINTLKGCVN